MKTKNEPVTNNAKLVIEKKTFLTSLRCTQSKSLWVLLTVNKRKKGQNIDNKVSHQKIVVGFKHRHAEQGKSMRMLCCLDWTAHHDEGKVRFFFNFIDDIMTRLVEFDSVHRNQASNPHDGLPAKRDLKVYLSSFFSSHRTPLE